MCTAMNMASMPIANPQHTSTMVLKRSLLPKNHVTQRISAHTMATAITYFRRECIQLDYTVVNITAVGDLCVWGQGFSWYNEKINHFLCTLDCHLMKLSGK